MKTPAFLGRYRALLIILLVTICIWIGASMSDVQSFPATYPVEWDGYDDARYVVIAADSMLTVGVQSNGFRALARSLSHRERKVVMQLAGLIPSHHDEQFTVGVGLKGSSDVLISQLRLRGVSHLDFGSDSLHITFAERRGKAFVPQIRDVDFAFAPQYGISGPITLIPDTVYLYGSAASLSRVQELHTRSGGFANINSSDTLLLDLDPVWERYPDLHPSQRQVRICLPVSRYAEGSATVPVTLQGVDATARYRLYPDKVKVTYWAPIDRYARITADQLDVTAELDPDSLNDNIPLTVTRFPGTIRIKKIEPDYVKYVILK